MFAPLVIVLSLSTDTALFVWTSWILPNRRVPIRALLPAAALGAVGLEALKLIGAYVVPRLVSHSSAIYGAIGVVFALLAWLLIFGRLVVYIAIAEAHGWERHHGERVVDLEGPALPAASRRVRAEAAATPSPRRRARTGAGRGGGRLGAARTRSTPG